MTQILGAVGLIGGIVGGIQQMDANGKAQKEAAVAMASQKKAEQDLLDEAKATNIQKRESKNLLAERDSQEKLLSPSKWSGASTILTGPLGVPASKGAVSASLLGN